MRKFFFPLLINIVNTKPVQKIFRAFVNSSFSRRMIPWYIRKYNVNTSEAEHSPEDYPTLADFFARRLREGARPIASPDDPRVLTAPVDSVPETYIADLRDARFTVKGKTCTLAELLDSKTEAARFDGGQLIVFYLSPGDYHRIHAPFDAAVNDRRSAGDRSAPVNEAGLRFCGKPLCENYRVIQRVSLAANPDTSVAVIFVGAINVNSIECEQLSQWRKGEEIGHFAFGSTVILAFERGAADLTAVSERIGKPIRVGEPIGFVNFDNKS